MSDEKSGDNKTHKYEKLEELEEQLRPLTYARFSKNLFIASGRPLAYASEVGESLRPVTPGFFVKSMYGLSIGYVLFDTAIKTIEQPKNKRMITCSDTLIFHTFASMLLPAVIIHKIVAYSGKALNHPSIDKSKIFSRMMSPSNLSTFKRFTPVALGLLSIPFIIHPIDHGTEYVMDRTVRKLYN